MQGLLTMLFMTYLSGGNPPLFMDFRKVWEPWELQALAKKLGLIDPHVLGFTWVTEFPLFEYSETEKRFVSTHHPFTSPVLV